jgi:Mg/Co/Ni transporter MgtE
VALRFQKYALISAAVVDQSGRLAGMITVDDIVHIIQEEPARTLPGFQARATATSTSR